MVNPGAKDICIGLSWISGKNNRIILFYTCDPLLKAEFALHGTHHKSSLLLAHILVYIIRPSRAIRLQVVHTVPHSIQLLCPLVELTRRPGAPAFISWVWVGARVWRRRHRRRWL
jgi:hypothetical protein